MDIARFRQGDPDVLRAVVASEVDLPWRVLRRGLCIEGPPRIAILGIEDYEKTFQIVVSILAARLTPSARASTASLEDFRRGVVEETVKRATKSAEAAGRAISIGADVPAGAVTPEQALSVLTTQPLLDPGARDRLTADRKTVAEALAQAPERTRELIRLRFEEGRSHEEIAKIFTCGRASVVERERRVRVELTRALKAPGRQVGPTELESILSSDLEGPCGATRDRIVERVFKQTFLEEPAPFARRASIALATLGAGAALWIAMYVGLLPSSASDVHRDPSVRFTCDGECLPGAVVRFLVQAPKKARAIAIMTLAGTSAEPLLVDPNGASLTLPFGAREAPTLMPFSVKWPTTSSASVVGIFSEVELSRADLERALHVPPPGTLVVSALRSDSR